MVYGKNIVLFGLLVCMLLMTGGCENDYDVPPISTKQPEVSKAPDDISEPIVTTEADSGDTKSSKPPTTGLGDNDVWFNSYPAGAEVYVIPATVDIYDLELDEIVKANNLLGTTPLNYDFSAGMYYVVSVFTPELFSAVGYELPTLSDPTFDLAFPFDGNLSQSMSYIDGEEIERFSKVYRLNKGSGNSDALVSIALPLPKNQRGQSKPALYPTLATVEALPVSYTFIDTDVRRAIEDNLEKSKLTAIVSPDMVDEMIEVLLRVGKVKLDTSDVDLIIQMKGTDSPSFSITTYG